MAGEATGLEDGEDVDLEVADPVELDGFDRDGHALIVGLVLVLLVLSEGRQARVEGGAERQERRENERDEERGSSHGLASKMSSAPITVQA